MNGDADEWSPDVAPREQLVDDAIDHSGWQRGRGPLRQRGIVHGDDAARRGDERSAREAVVHSEIEAQQVLDPRTLRAAPTVHDRADDAEARRHVATRSADGEDERADVAGVRSGARRGRSFRSFARSTTRSVEASRPMTVASTDHRRGERRERRRHGARCGWH